MSNGYPHYTQGYPSNQPGYPPNQSGYPPTGQPGYPPAGQPGYPPAGQPGYPPTGQSGYPPSGQPGYPPGQPGYPQAQPGYPPSQSQPGFHPGYPSQPGYPSTQPGYPPSQPGYPPSQPGYPPSQPGYPPSQPGYPSNQPGYPPAQPGYPPTQPGLPSGYPSSQPGYAPSQPGHIPSQSGYPSGSYGQPAAGPGYTKPVHKGKPTVFPANPFDPVKDAEILRKAMKGFGTDEKAIIKILTKRTNDQRQHIAAQFKTLYGKDLVSDLKSETSGKFEKLLVAMMTPTYVFLAKELYHAMEGIGTNEKTLIEILATRTNAEIHAIREAYGQEYGHNLEEDLRDESSGHFKRLLTSLCQGNRNENYAVDIQAAQNDARSLQAAGRDQVGTDESTFNAILCTRSYPQLAEVFSEYYKLTGKELDEDIESEFSGDIKEALIAIFKCVLNKPGFLAQQLRQSMEGFGTDDRALTRIVVSRSEIDMGDIKDVYRQMFDKRVEDDIESDCSGDYKKCLLALVEG